MTELEKNYKIIRGGGCGFYKQSRGVFEIHGTEAAQFFNGLITNDVAKLEEGGKMNAAFPTLKGRMFAVVRVMRKGERFLIETAPETRQKVFENLFRFTFAGDFHLEEKSDLYSCFSIFGSCKFDKPGTEGVIDFGNDYLVPVGSAEEFAGLLGPAVEISEELYEILRIESGIPRYGIDMDEETVVPEVGIENLISYQKGCYIGQEVIARIHFRGKPAKQMVGLVFEDESGRVKPGDELTAEGGRNAGTVTSVTYSPELGKTIALGYVRNAFLEAGTRVASENAEGRICRLPFIE